MRPGRLTGGCVSEWLSHVRAWWKGEAHVQNGGGSTRGRGQSLEWVFVQQLPGG